MSFMILPKLDSNYTLSLNDQQSYIILELRLAGGQGAAVNDRLAAQNIEANSVPGDPTVGAVVDQGRGRWRAVSKNSATKKIDKQRFYLLA